MLFLVKSKRHAMLELLPTIFVLYHGSLWELIVCENKVMKVETQLVYVILLGIQCMAIELVLTF